MAFSRFIPTALLTLSTLASAADTSNWGSFFIQMGDKKIQGQVGEVNGRRVTLPLPSDSSQAGAQAPSNPIQVVHLSPTRPSTPSNSTDLASFVPSPTTLTTSDSSVLINYIAPDDASWINIGISKPGQDGKPGSANDIVFILPATPGPTSQKLYLLGEGTFRINFFSTNQKDRNNNNSFKYVTGFVVTNSDFRDLSFLEPSPDVQSDAPEILELALSLTQGLNSDREKSIAIHNWVASNISYDAADALAKPSPIYPIPDALSTLHRRIAVCEGYANLNAALHRAAGIRAKNINGAVAPMLSSNTGNTGNPASNSLSCSTINHRWNEILINGQWLIQDATFDAGGIDIMTEKFNPHLSDKYLFPDLKTFQQDHLKCQDYRD